MRSSRLRLNAAFRDLDREAQERRIRESCFARLERRKRLWTTCLSQHFDGCRADIRLIFACEQFAQQSRGLLIRQAAGKLAAQDSNVTIGI